MLLYKALAFVAIAICSCKADERLVHEKPPQELFGSENEELLKERPLAFKPDEGQHFRRDFEQKHGYRGERLIAKLGGGPTPLSIYDASLIKHTTSPPAPSTAGRHNFHPHSTSTTEPPTITPSRRRSYKSETEVTAVPVPVPYKRKYTNVSRNKKERKSIYKSVRSSRKLANTEAAIENEPSQLPAAEEAAVQKRLYRAIWNHGLRGLTDSDRVTENLINLGSIAPPNFSNLDLMQQLAGAINLNHQQTFNLTPLPSTDNFASFPGDGNLLHALAQSAAVDSQATENVAQAQPAEVEGAEPSLQQYAGVGEPSLLVASYSYSEVGEKTAQGDSTDQAQDRAVDGQQTGQQQQQDLFASDVQQHRFDPPIAELDQDPLSGGTELRPQFVKP